MLFRSAESAEAALPLLAKKPGCDAAILDVMLPGLPQSSP